MKQSAFIVTGLLLLPGPAAIAADTSIKAAFSQGLEVSDNAFLRPTPRGTTVTSISNLFFDGIARAPDSRFQLTTDLNYRAYSGADTTGMPDAVGYGLRAEMEKKHRLTTYNVVGLVRREDAAAAQLNESGNVAVRGDILTYGFQGGLAHEYSPIDKLQLSASARKVDFTAANGTPFTDIGATGAWNRRIDPTTDWISVAAVQRLDYDNATETERTILRATTGVIARRTRTITVTGNIGGVFLKSAHGMPTPGLSSGWTSGVHADVGLLYKAKTSELSMGAARSIQPDSVGNVYTTDSARLGIRQSITPLSHWFAAAGYTHSVNDNGIPPTDYFTGTIGYGHRLTRELQLLLTYRYLLRDGGLGDASSNTFFARISYDYVLAP